VSTVAEPASGQVVFFDLLETLVRPDGKRYVPTGALEPWLGDEWRRGVLCNLGPRRSGRTILRILEEAGLDGHFDPDLLVLASNLPQMLPDRRAFAAAAALAEAPVGECAFVSADAELRSAAAAAGMKSEEPPAAAEAGAELVSAGEGPAPTPTLLAGEIDEDVGPTFVLTGRVVTMNAKRDVHEDGQVAISNGQIVAVAPKGKKLPAAFSSAPRIDTEGTIYPGLMDLHNHFVYNVLGLWTVPKRFDDRNQWPRSPSYAGEVTLPVRALAEAAKSARALVRYVEAKALVGGTSTGQGIRTRVNGGPKLFRGAMRNVEVTDDPRLPEAGTLVPTLYVNEERVKAFRRSLETRASYFYHLAEGVDAAARKTFTDLAENDLLAPALVGIHCLGLEPEDLKKFAAAGAKTVWSPLSNLLLYGRTHDLAAFKEAGVPLAIGCDWSPSGSKNLLQELKVARWVADQQKVEFSDEELVACVTSTPAEVVKWAPYVGSVAEQAMADLLVIAGTGGDPYGHLIEASEADIRLLLVHGVARFGERELMEQLHPKAEIPLETWKLGKAERAFNFFAQGSEINDVTLADATETLSKAMSDLPAFREESEQAGAQLNSFGLEAPSFVVDLDNEFEPSPEELEEGAEAGLLADWSRIASSVPLDTPVVDEEAYWKQLESAANLPAGLAAAVRGAYGK
jgi:5-methylthioadenosine/S-adenosylhomocysteine deaminase